MKDTFRIVVWVVMAAFSLGTLWAQRKSDMDTINTRLERSEKLNKELGSRLESSEMTLRSAQQGNAAILAALDGVRTELRYVNEKIDTLRQDLRESRRVSRE